MCASALSEEVVCFLCASPVCITIHCVVATYDCCDVCFVLEFEFTNFVLDFADEFLGRAFWDIAAVSDGVYVDFFELFLFCETEE